MKFDKETVVVMAICMILFIAWTPICKYMGWTQEPSPVKDEGKLTSFVGKKAVESGKNSVADVKTSSTATSKNSNESQKTLSGILESASVEKISLQSLSNDLVTVTIDPNSAGVTGIVLKRFFNSDYKTHIELQKSIQQGALSVRSRADWTLLSVHAEKLSDISLKVVRHFRKDDGNFSITQIWTLDKNYKILCSIELDNSGGVELDFKDFTVSAGALPPIKELSGDTPRRETYSIDFCFVKTDKFVSVDATDKDDEDFHEADTSDPLSWIGVSNKYFTLILIPEEPFNNGSFVSRETLKSKSAKSSEYFLATASGRFDSFTLGVGERKAFDFTYYSGPKELSLLDGLGPKTTNVMQLAWWGQLEWIAQWLLYFLNYLKDIFGSYGWSIIVLTIIVKMLFWPITQRANNSMKKMQKIQPLVKDLREKCKDNPQKLNTETMALYKEHKVHPLGGCLPILLQLPIFFALFSTLDGAVELRHTAFWWAQDLSRPDAIGPVIFGYQLHPLAITMTLLMVLQQRMTPSSIDPAQQKMMMLMPIVMLFFFYSMPSGLTLYWTVSQIISIIQLLINKRKSKDDEPLEVAA